MSYQFPNADLSNVEVIVKRRRIAPTLAKHDSAADAERARTPRVYRTGPLPCEISPKVSEPTDASAALLDNGAAAATRVVPRRRRRRDHAHGHVTILRPSLQGPEALSFEADPGMPPPLVKNGTRARRSRSTQVDADFGPSRRYEMIVAEIARLKRAARAARKAEVAAAVRWIRKMIAAYGIEPAELAVGNTNR
jgi:hypothetical protein